MKVLYSLVVVSFALPLLAATDERHRKVKPIQVATGSLKSASTDDRNDLEAENSGRALTWSHHWRWSSKKQKKSDRRRSGKSRKKKNYYGTPVSTSGVSCDCEESLEKFDLTAYMGNSIASASSVNEIGGKYVYNAELARNTDLSEPLEGDSSAFITGDCTRLQNLEIMSDGNRVLGAGLCTFTLSVITSELQGSMVLQGELFDVIPSTFAITGGTGGFYKAHGTVTFMPVYDDGGTDVFTQASHVELNVDARVRAR